MQWAAGRLDEVRRDGAASAIRSVEVQHWGDGDRDSPPLCQASYYDPEQGLTEAEAYAARVHDWHAPADSWNRSATATGSKWGMGYSSWSDDWGPQADVCPACGDTLGQGEWFRIRERRSLFDFQTRT